VSVNYSTLRIAELADINRERRSLTGRPTQQMLLRIAWHQDVWILPGRSVLCFNKLLRFFFERNFAPPGKDHFPVYYAVWRDEKFPVCVFLWQC